MKSKTRKAAGKASLDPLVRKSEVLRLLDEYRLNHTADAHAKTILRAIGHDVVHDLPNASVRGGAAAPYPGRSVGPEVTP